MVAIKHLPPPTVGQKRVTLSKLFTMWKHSLPLRWSIIKNNGCWPEVRFTVLHLTIQKVDPQCEMALHVYLSPASDHRHSPSCPSPFMLQAPRVDLSLLVCAVEDSWTSSFLYKSPSEPDSGDSDLIRASNKRYQHHLGSGFIFSSPHYSLGPFKALPNGRSSHSIESGGLGSCFWMFST